MHHYWQKNWTAKIKNLLKQVSQTVSLVGQQLAPPQTHTIGWISVAMLLKTTIAILKAAQSQSVYTFWLNQPTNDFKHINAHWEVF